MANIVSIYEHDPADLAAKFSTEEGRTVAERFHKDWDVSNNAPPRPHVFKVFRIADPPQLAQFQGLQSRTRDDFKYTNSLVVNVNRPWLLPSKYKGYVSKAVNSAEYRYHGTKRGRGCTIGEIGKDMKVNNAFCRPVVYCALCSIMHKGFDVTRSGDYLKLGKGVYSTSSSLKADRYSYASKDHQHKCMLISWVHTAPKRTVTGKRISLDAAEKFKREGFRSLEGVPSDSLRLSASAAYRRILDHNVFSHPETLTFDAKDTIPIHLIIYENHEWAKYHRY